MDDYPFIQGFGSTHEMRDADDSRKSRLWGLKSTSKAACIASDKRLDQKAHAVGFVHVKK